MELYRLIGIGILSVIFAFVLFSIFYFIVAWFKQFIKKSENE